ncbi:MAG: ATP-binding protein [Tepidibacter sp.]|jgi:DNA replication protein DnaC|uniref:ATP-binding protein n=1 Tax=Tepidibacter sp. TaxID=2529387 RepID=UPI0025ED8B91|nr:ATP-binding protein [Tepidibacter sp.]MCT4508214.1 ATP-binding protein [Tepidibacter sp.]
MNDDKLRDIFIKYEHSRDNSKLDLEARKNKIYNKIPQIKEIDDKIFQIGLSLSKAVLMSDGDRQEIIDKSKIEMENLKKQKEAILAQNKIPLDYLQMHYNCDKCKDKGFTKDGSQCECFKQELIKNAYKISNFSKLIEKENFDTFDINLFRDEKIYAEGISQRENMLSIYSACESFTLDFNKDNEENLLFYGSTGVGKTFMCSCIAKKLLDKGYTVLYETSYNIIELLQNYRFEKNHTYEDKRNYRLLFECDLLIIDDLGSEMTNTFTISELFNIINSRLIDSKKTIISTNLSPMEIANTYTDRIFSRISSHYTFLKFIGEDLRWEK